MKWSAVITTFNSGAVIEGALESILSLHPQEKPVDVVVVDNASTDRTIEVLERYSGEIRMIRNNSNLGLARANNLGAGIAGGDALFFLNPDARLLPGCTGQLRELQETRPEAAILGPRMVDEDHRLQSSARTWPTVSTIAARRTFLGNTSAGMRIARHHMFHYHRGIPVRPQWLVGAALWLTPAGRERVGPMPESYFLYFEDVEWCLQCWKKGMEVWYVPSAMVRHSCSRESTTPGAARRYHLRSMLRYFMKHPAAAMGFGPGGDE